MQGADTRSAEQNGEQHEQIGLSGELLGNFPQAFTHLALISAATTLDRALGNDAPVRSARAG